MDRADGTQRPTAPLRLALELRTGAPAMTGSLYDERGAEHAFTGWLGLLTLLEAAHSRTAPAPAAEGA